MEQRGNKGGGGGVSNLGFPVNDVSSRPMSFIKLTSVSQTFLLRLCVVMLHESEAAGPMVTGKRINTHQYESLSHRFCRKICITVE